MRNPRRDIVRWRSFICAAPRNCRGPRNREDGSWISKRLGKGGRAVRWGPVLFDQWCSSPAVALPQLYRKGAWIECPLSTHCGHSRFRSAIALLRTSAHPFSDVGEFCFSRAARSVFWIPLLELNVGPMAAQGCAATGLPRARQKRLSLATSLSLQAAPQKSILIGCSP